MKKKQKQDLSIFFAKFLIICFVFDLLLLACVIRIGDKKQFFRLHFERILFGENILSNVSHFLPSDGDKSVHRKRLDILRASDLRAIEFISDDNNKISKK